MNQKDWVIGTMVLDVLVIATNVIEQIFIVRGWKHLDRIDHLLLSLSVSDLIFGLSTLTIDSWYLHRVVLSLKPRNDINATSCFSIQLGQNTSLHYLDRHHKIVNCTVEGLFIFTIFVSVFHVMALAVERLYAVRFPQRYYIFTLFKTKFFTIAIIWSIGFIVTIIQVGVLEYQAYSSMISRAVLLAFITVSVFVLYSVVAYFLFKQHRSMTRDFSSDSYVDLGRLRRLTIICLFLGVSCVVCNALTVVNWFDELFLGNHWSKRILPDWFHYVSSFMVTLNSIINPCIYLVKMYYDSKVPTLRKGRGESANLVGNEQRHGHTITTLVEGRGSWRSLRSGSGILVKSKSNDFLMKPEISSGKNNVFST